MVVMVTVVPDFVTMLISADYTFQRSALPCLRKVGKSLPQVGYMPNMGM